MRNNNVSVQDLWMNCFPAMIELRRKINEGAVGEVKLVTAAFLCDDHVSDIALTPSGPLNFNQSEK